MKSLQIGHIKGLRRSYSNNVQTPLCTANMPTNQPHQQIHRSSKKYNRLTISVVLSSILLANKKSKVKELRQDIGRKSVHPYSNSRRINYCNRNRMQSLQRPQRVLQIQQFEPNIFPLQYCGKGSSNQKQRDTKNQKAMSNFKTLKEQAAKLDQDSINQAIQKYQYFKNFSTNERQKVPSKSKMMKTLPTNFGSFRNGKQSTRGRAEVLEMVRKRKINQAQWQEDKKINKENHLGLHRKNLRRSTAFNYCNQSSLICHYKQQQCKINGLIQTRDKILSNCLQ